MQGDIEKGGRGFSGIALIAVLIAIFLLPVLYVLSIGPVTMMYPDGFPLWLIRCYDPLRWVLERSTTAQDWYIWYLSFWVVEEVQ